MVKYLRKSVRSANDDSRCLLPTDCTRKTGALCNHCRARSRKGLRTAWCPTEAYKALYFEIMDKYNVPANEARLMVLQQIDVDARRAARLTP